MRRAEWQVQKQLLRFYETITAADVEIREKRATNSGRL